MKKQLARMALGMAALLVLYTVLMTLAYAIPNSWIDGNVTASLNVYQTEGDYAQYFFGYPFGQVDNVTDQLMYKLLLKGDGSALREAMIPTYARYWHGYASILRPLSVLLNVVNLRYVNMALLIVLLSACFTMCVKRFGWPIAIVFVLGLTASFIWIAPFCLQFWAVTLLTLLGSLVVLVRGERFGRNAPLFFMALGSLTHFFDFLTFPILTLGYPLLLALLLRQKNVKMCRTFSTELRFLVTISVSWCVGYGLTLLGKGAIGTLLTGENVFSDISTNVAFRVSGELPETFGIRLTAWSACWSNIKVFFNLRTIALLGLTLAVLVCAAVRWHKPRTVWMTALPILGVALFPYVWYAVLQNHSNVHFFFASKAQAVSFFALCGYVTACVDWTAVRNAIVARRDKRKASA